MLAVLPVFPFGTPPFNRLVGEFRDHVCQEVAGSNLSGLIITMMWVFNLEGDRAFVEKQKAVFEAEGGRTVFVELQAPLEIRIAWNEAALRLSAKPSKWDILASRERLVAAQSAYQLDSCGDFPFAEYLRIDNTDLLPRVAAERIADHFGVGPHTEDPDPGAAWRGRLLTAHAVEPSSTRLAARAPRRHHDCNSNPSVRQPSP